LTTYWLRDHAHLAWELPMPLPTWFFLSYRLEKVLKACSQSLQIHLGPIMLCFVFPSLTFNKLHYTHMFRHRFFLTGHKEFGRLLSDHRLHLDDIKVLKELI
jgi:hypothetical protein